MSGGGDGLEAPRRGQLRRTPTAATTVTDPIDEPELPEAVAGPGARRAAPRRSLWRRIVDSPTTTLVIVSIALGLLIGGFTAYYDYTRPATYRSAAVLLIDQDRAIAASNDDGIINKLARLRVKYVGLVGTRSFQQPLAEQTGLSPGVIAGGLLATADPTSLLVRVAATTGSAANSKTLAQAAADHLVSYAADEQGAAGVPAAQRVTFSVVSPAGGAVEVTPDRHRAMLVGAFVFVALTIVGMLGADLLRRRRLGR